MVCSRRFSGEALRRRRSGAYTTGVIDYERVGSPVHDLEQGRDGPAWGITSYANHPARGAITTCVDGVPPLR
ncbi:hypothetical protein BSU04_03680 [Caballeronia sordidicola]|uniref:Uncharacterized protein n=1 Tax=Caballeronia sordidicola TaxID=196367 RepID=A0A226X8X3_CABSO|nr:hypothetical protein BSU04_03680 [Caballeronia sordidicola]